jgi:hypothetical protein
MAVSAKNFTLVNFFYQLMPGSFGVLTYGKQFFAQNMIEIKRRRMRVVPAAGAPTLCFYLVDQIAPRLLKTLRHQLFAWRVVPTFRLAVFLPRSRWNEHRGAS